MRGRKWLTFLMVGALLFGITFSTTGINANAKAQANNEYTGEELYKAILFGQGEASNLLDDLWTEEGKETSNTEQGLDFTNKLVKSIKTSDPDYFEDLEDAIYSGNQVEIENTLELGGEYLGKYVESGKYQPNKSVIADGGAEGTCVLYVAYAAAAVSAVAGVTHAVVATAGGAVVAYLAVTTTKYLWNGKKSIGETTQFGKEAIVNEVATSFAN
ncbi:sporulation delaying protein family toxin [Peribacillus sp. NPDC097295]|uniref:sporulation delaying protein family toxin n=1 Tax=Peribacillus sp. NPDC097295 TaxID=3364402 RepID=UPI00380F7C76